MVQPLYAVTCVTRRSANTPEPERLDVFQLSLVMNPETHFHTPPSLYAPVEYRSILNREIVRPATVGDRTLGSI
jgi:hypothetical protein